MTTDIKDFFYGTPMEPSDYEHAQLSMDLMPQEIIDQCHLMKLAVNNKVYFVTQKGMPGLKQAGIIANERLAKTLTSAGCVQSKFIPSLWKHCKYDVSFTLVVDDLGVKYVGQTAIKHLLDTLRKDYTITTDWTGTNYIGFTLNWDYINHHVTLSMPNFVKKALHRLMHEAPSRPVHSPSQHTPPIYGKKVQFVEPDKNLPMLSPPELKRIQQAVGIFLYYARAQDMTMAVAINDLAAAQSKGNEETMKALVHLLNYAATHPDA